MKIRFLFPTLLLLFSISLSAQTVSKEKYTKTELKTFTKAYQYVLDHPFDIESSIKRGVKTLGISEERIGEILQAEFAGEEIELSQVEISQLEKLKTLMAKDKAKYDSDINTFLEKNNIKPSTYRAIEKQYFAKKTLQNKVRKLSKNN